MFLPGFFSFCNDHLTVGADGKSTGSGSAGGSGAV